MVALGEPFRFSVRVMKLLGVEQLLVTNAGGGLNSAFNVSEYIGLQHFSG